MRSGLSLLLWALIALGLGRIVERVDTLMLEPIRIQHALLGKSNAGLLGLEQVEISGNITGDAHLQWTYRLPRDALAALGPRCRPWPSSPVPAEGPGEDRCLLAATDMKGGEMLLQAFLSGNRLIITSTYIPRYTTRERGAP